MLKNVVDATVEVTLNADGTYKVMTWIDGVKSTTTIKVYTLRELYNKYLKNFGDVVVKFTKKSRVQHKMFGLVEYSKWTDQVIASINYSDEN